MKYLFIDTSFNKLIISIIEDNKILYYYNKEENNDMSNKVMLVIEEAFNKTNLNIRDINKIFIVTGPGSFTGIRIGVTIAKVIGLMLNIPLIPISRLALMATTKVETLYCMPIIDARRDYVYGALFDSELNVIKKEEHILFEDLKNSCSDYTVITDKNMDIDLIKIINKYKDNKPINSHNLNPNYLKKTEAEEKLDD